MGGIPARIADFLLGAPRGSVVLYGVVLAVASLAGSSALVMVAYEVAALLGVAPLPDEGPEHPITLVHFLGLFLFAPVVETAMLAVQVTVVGHLVRSRWAVGVVSALLWGGLHALVWPFWFFGTVWSFFLYACGYLRWRRQSRTHAFAAAAIPHALVNASAFAMLALWPAG